MPGERRLAKIRTVLNWRQPDLTVVMENIHDPHNVSAMLRSCDAAGVLQVQLVYTKEAFPKVGRKSSASAGKWVERRKFGSIEKCYAALRQEGFLILATRIGDVATSLFEIDFTRKVAIVFGNEHRGVSDEAAAGADGLVRIPMMGMIQSLNVSVACAVTLYEAMRQRIGTGAYDSPKLSQRALKILLDEWGRK